VTITRPKSNERLNAKPFRELRSAFEDASDDPLCAESESSSRERRQVFAAGAASAKWPTTPPRGTENHGPAKRLLTFMKLGKPVIAL